MDLREACPDANRLRALLEGALSDAEGPVLVEHLDRCPKCREQLDRWAASADPLAGWKPTFGADRPALSPALERVLSGLKATPPVDGPGATTELDTEPPTVAQTIPAEPPRTAALPSAIPARIGLYDLVARIGEGGMGVVYKAVDARLNRVVAVKVLSAALASSALARRRFTREAQAAAAVCHEHVVTIHAVDEADGLPYLVMQYIAGQSLQEKIDRAGPLGLKEVLRIGMQVASGLAAAHAQGLVHRDIKPANILLENGVERAKITDFGLARAATDARITASGIVAGTPQFMAPEQARGERCDHRADLFSLGSVLYAMATGEAPFGAESTVAVLRKVSDESARPVRELNPEAPVWLSQFIDRLMAKDPKRRYQTAAEVAELLGARLAEVQRPGGFESETAAGPKTAGDRRSGWRRGGALLAGAVALAAIIAVVVALVPTRQPVANPDASNLPAAQHAPAAEHWLAKGLEAYKRKDYAHAAEFLSDALTHDPKSVRALMARGEARRYLRDYAGGLADYTEAIRLQPTNAAAYFGRSGIETDKSDFAPALADAEEALRRDPKLTWAYFARGLAHKGLKHWDRAIVDFSTFIDEVPDFPPSLQGRATCYAARGELTLAVADLDQAVRLKPDNLGFRHHRAWIRARLGNYDLAIADYTRLLRDDPNSVDKLCDRASTYALAGQYKEAEADFEASIRRAGNRPWPLIRRAYNLHFRRGNFDAAITDCDAMIAIDPKIAEAYFYRGLALLGKNEYARAAADFDHALQLDQPDGLTFQGEMRLRYPELHEARAEARAKLGDEDGAAQDRAAAARLRAARGG